MTQPRLYKSRKRNTPQLHLPSLLHRRRRNNSCLLYFSLCIIITGLIAILTTSQYHKNNQRKSNQDLAKELNALSFKLNHEDRFTNTIKSCTDLSNCGHHKVQVQSQTKNGSGMGRTSVDDDKLQRIAIISPPLHEDIADYITNALQSSLVTYYGFDVSIMNSKLEIITTTHVPPYGYGKNHGYTKIIRLRNDPLLFDVMGSYMEAITNHKHNPLHKKKKKKRKRKVDMKLISSWNSPEGRITLQQTLRQIIRWQCRLSHVAAHTTMYNLNLSSNTFMKDMKDVLELILYDDDPTIPKKREEELKLENEQLKNAFQTLQDTRVDLVISSLMEEIVYQVENLSRDGEYMDVLSNALLDELDQTNDLKKWPCLSFWNVHEGEGKERGDKLMTLSQFLATRLVPSCSDPFTTCSVKRDTCEENGDPVCK